MSFINLDNALSEKNESSKSLIIFEQSELESYGNDIENITFPKIFYLFIYFN